jgi:hypothetical protein
VPKHCLASDRAAQQHLKGAAKKWKFEWINVFLNDCKFTLTFRLITWCILFSFNKYCFDFTQKSK